MSTTVRIAGVDVPRMKNSLSIAKPLDSRVTASFVVVDNPGTGNYLKGQPVDIFTGLAVPPFIHPQFTGFIERATRVRQAPTEAGLYWNIDCIDNHYLADKRIAAESYTAQTAAAIVTALWTKYLSPEGVTLGTIDTGPTIAEMVVNYRSVSDTLDTLANRSNKTWYINVAKQLFFVARNASAAPFAVVARDMLRRPQILSRLTESAPKYRNRQYIRAGRELTAPQIETLAGNGSNVSFTVGYPIASTPTVTVGGAPQTVGIKGIDEAKNCYWAKNDPIVVFDSGSTPAPAAAVVISYIGFFDILVMADSIAEQLARKAIEGGTGLVEALADEPSINSIDDALDSAQSKLAYYGVTGRQFSFPIDKWGLEPGQLVNVTNAAYGIADDLLVESVHISELAPGELMYDIKAIDGPATGDWTGFFKALTNEALMERITVGKDQVLIILAETREIWKWSESITETVWACPVPSVTLFPLVTLYPC